MNRRAWICSVLLPVLLWLLLGPAAPAARAEEGEVDAEQAIVLPPLPELTPGPTLTLAQALRLADRDNRSLRTVRQDVQTAEEKLRASWAVLLPNLSGNLTYTYMGPSGGDQQTGGQTGGQTFNMNQDNNASVGLALNVPLVSAQRWLSIPVARRNRELSALQVEQTRQALLYSVAQAYFQAATTQALIAVYHTQLEAIRSHLDVALARDKAGVGNLVDIRTAQTDLVAAWNDLVNAHYALADARDALAVLLGTDDLPLPVADPGSVPIAPEGADPETDAGLVGRWDLQVARQQTRLLTEQLTAQYMQFAPTLSGSFQYNYALTAPSIPGFHYDRNRWTLGLVLSVPLFDYTFYPTLAEQRSSLRQSRLREDELATTARQQVRQARRNIEKYERLVAAARQKADLADELLRLAEQDYATGHGLAINVIDARRSSQAAHVALTTQSFQLEMARLAYGQERGLDLLQVVGR